MRTRTATIISKLVLAAGLLGGCVATTPEVTDIYKDLQSEDPAVRIQAAVKAGNTRDAKAIPLLVDRLTDTDSDVRMFASIALRKITGEEHYDKMGWQFYDKPDQRDVGVRNWRNWLKNRTRDKAAETTSTTQPS